MVRFDNRSKRKREEKLSPVVKYLNVTGKTSPGIPLLNKTSFPIALPWKSNKSFWK